VDDQERQALIEQIVAARTAIFRAMRADWSKEGLGADLTLPQIRVLFLLEQEGGRSMSSLAEALGKAQPTVTGLVDRLVESGLVRRAEHPADRRITIVQLTPAGAEVIARIAAAGDDHTRRLVGRLATADLRLVARAYAVLRRAALALASEPAVGDRHGDG
jgi:DNA-binding MarR family transcriptional regulator